MIEVVKEEQKIQVEKIAKENNLKFVILYGSFAKGNNQLESDFDIAVLGEKEIESEQLLVLFDKFSEIFFGKEIDIKSLHKVNPMFRYFVLRDGILLYGNNIDYLEFKSFAFRDYNESKSLFRLQEILIKKRQEVLLKI